MAAGGAVVLGLLTVPAGAHFPAVQGTTVISPTSGGRGSSVTGSAQGANTETGSPYVLMFADSSEVETFEQGGQDHSEACAHGAPISEPVEADAKGNIPETSSFVPPFAAGGRAVMCFHNGSQVTAPVEFTVE